MAFHTASFFRVSHATGEVRQHILASHFISRPGLPVDVSWLCSIDKACCWNAPSSLLSFTLLLMEYPDNAASGQCSLCQWLLYPTSLLPSQSCSCFTHFNINMDNPSNNVFSSWPSHISLWWLRPGLDHHAPYGFIIWILSIPFLFPVPLVSLRLRLQQHSQPVDPTRVNIPPLHTPPCLFCSIPTVLVSVPGYTEFFIFLDELPCSVRCWITTQNPGSLSKCHSSSQWGRTLMLHD